jgi:hypothetical protein
MKEYIVVLKSDPTQYWYSVDAPSKRVACWCAFNVLQNEYCNSIFKPSDFKAYPAKWTMIKNIEEIKR